MFDTDFLCVVCMPPTRVHIPLKHNDTLAKHGYHDVKRLSVSARHAALVGAVMEHGATYVIRKLNALGVFNKYRHPELTAVFRSDMHWVQEGRDAGVLPRSGRRRRYGRRRALKKY